MAFTSQLKAKTYQPKKKTADATGIPVPVKEDFEAAYQLSLDDVRVHYNSSAPAQLQALAYTQHPHIYIAPGQEKHLPHELGHMIQQKRHSIPATASVNGQSINDNPLLEADADRIAVRAAGYSRALQALSAHPVMSHDKNVSQAFAGNTAAPASGNAIQLMGERKAMKSVMSKPEKRLGIRRGNVIQDILKTGGISREKVAELRNTLCRALENRLRKNKKISAAVNLWLFGDWSAIYAIASGELAKLAGAGNCGEYADATFSTLAGLGHRQYIYTCSMRSTDPKHPYDHAFTMTSPFFINQFLLDFELLNEQELEKATVVDAWFNYRIMPLKRFLQQYNPYGAKLTQKNIKIMTKVAPYQIPGVQTLVPVIHSEAVDVYYRLHNFNMKRQTRESLLQQPLHSRGMFGLQIPLDVEIAEEVEDSRSGLARCMDKLKISTEEQFRQEFPRLPIHDRIRLFIDYDLPVWTILL